jgi:soluble lytic murein transglycosylase
VLNMTINWRNLAILACSASMLAALPSHAADVESPAALAPTANVEQSVPPILTPATRTRYQQMLTALKAKRWGEARALLEADTGGPLTAWFHAQLLLAPDSPRAELTDLEPLLRAAPELPQAARLASLASKRAAPDHRALGRG